MQNIKDPFKKKSHAELVSAPLRISRRDAEINSA
jgi:hypothetical protein